jgi:hypothetical protein
VEPATLRLYPGTTEQVRLTFTPPRGPDPAAGPHPYGVRVSPAEAPDAVTVTEGNVSVAPFTDMRAELLPVVVRGWRKAKPKLAVDNYGNTLVTASVQAAVQDNSVDFETRTPSFQVEPGRAHFTTFTGRPSRTLWFGRKVNHPFAATVTPSGGMGIPGAPRAPGNEATRVTGTYVQTTLMPTWISRMLMLLILLLLAAVALWFYAKPSVTSEATPQLTSTPAAASQPTKPAAASPSASASTAASQTAAAPPSTPASASKPRGQAPAVTLPSALGYWKLNDGDNGAAATNAADSSGNGHPATGANAAWCGGAGCAWFNGTSSDFTTSGPILNTGANASFTVAAYVNLQSIPANGAFATAVSQDSSTNSGFYLQYSGADKCWAFARVTSSAADRAKGCTGNYTNTWTFLTGTFNASTQELSLYVNGKLTHTATDTAPNVSDGALAIGRGQSGASTDWWPGWIMQVRVYQQVLNAKQVQLLYKTTPTNGK